MKDWTVWQRLFSSEMPVKYGMGLKRMANKNTETRRDLVKAELEEKKDSTDVDFVGES